MKVDDWYSYHQYLERYPRRADRRSLKNIHFRVGGKLYKASKAGLMEELTKRIRK